MSDEFNDSAVDTSVDTSDTSAYAQADIPDDVPENIPIEEPDDVSDDISDELQEDTEDISDESSDDFDDVPEDTYDDMLDDTDNIVEDFEEDIDDTNTLDEDEKASETEDDATNDDMVENEDETIEGTDIENTDSTSETVEIADDIKNIDNKPIEDTIDAEDTYGSYETTDTDDDIANDDLVEVDDEVIDDTSGIDDADDSGETTDADSDIDNDDLMEVDDEVVDDTSNTEDSDGSDETTDVDDDIVNDDLVEVDDEVVNDTSDIDDADGSDETTDADDGIVNDDLVEVDDEVVEDTSDTEDADDSDEKTDADDDIVDDGVVEDTSDTEYTDDSDETTDTDDDIANDDLAEVDDGAVEDTTSSDDTVSTEEDGVISNDSTETDGNAPNKDTSETENETTNEDTTESKDDESKNEDSNELSAFDEMNQYMSERNYGREDFGEYSQDPEWQKLNNALISADGKKQTEATGDLNPPPPSVQEDNVSPIEDKADYPVNQIVQTPETLRSNGKEVPPVVTPEEAYAIENERNGRAIEDTTGVKDIDGSENLIIDEVDNVNDNIIDASISEADNRQQEMIEGQNFNANKDITNAFDFADRNYDRESEHWQEVANRQLDNLNHEKATLEMPLYDAQRIADEKQHQISDYVMNNALSQEAYISDEKYQKMANEYAGAQDNYDKLSKKYSLLSAKINDISTNIIPEMKTEYRGMNGTDFQNSYNDYITERQGNAVPGFGGVCGINETCNIVNQQTGSKLGEADGINEYVSKGLCKTNSDYSKNGGTNAIGRSIFLDGKGLTFHRIEGSNDNGVGFTLDDVAQRFNNGESAGLMLKAQDLSQSDLSSRSINPLKVDTWNAQKANHATTIAGFSYGNDGKASGVWLNDTGGWAESNRVFIGKDKFSQMQTNTKGFAVEFSRRGDD